MPGVPLGTQNLHGITMQAGRTLVRFVLAVVMYHDVAASAAAVAVTTIIFLRNVLEEEYNGQRGGADL